MAELNRNAIGAFMKEADAAYSGGEIHARSNVVASRNNFGQFVSKCELAAQETMRETVRRGANMSRQMAPVGEKPNRHGIKLIDSIRTREISAIQGEWVSIAPHAMYVEKGTNAWVKYVGNVRFFWDKRGRMFYTHNYAFGPEGRGLAYENWNYAQGVRINHPGTPAQPFLRPAYEIVVRQQMMDIAKEKYPG